MKRTKNLFLNKPDREDYVKVDDLNVNADITDEQLTLFKTKLETKAPLESPKFFGTPVIYNIDTKKDEPIATINNISAMLEVEKF